MAFDMKKMKQCHNGVVDNVDAMNEIFKHLDAQTLAMASCVSRQWYQAAMDDNLWEVICTKRWPATGISLGRLRCVVNAMGGFRRLYAKWLHPLRTQDKAFKEDDVAWSGDQIQLSLSLFSVDYFERLGPFRTGSCYGSTSIPSKPRLLQNVDSGSCIPPQSSNRHS